MAVRTGLEPATSCVTGRHSNQLNYRTKVFKTCFIVIGDPYGIRTRVTAVKGRCLNRLTKGPLFIWRRRRDLNPRASCPTYTLSRGASSAT
jgi:hypothetical protein